jgi:phage terminase large subunit-like protein
MNDSEAGELAAMSGGGPRPHGLGRALADVEAFGTSILKMPLRPYQAEVARAILASIGERRGLTITVLMPRQSGKNQLSAHLEAYLLVRRQRAGGSLEKSINSPLCR